MERLGPDVLRACADALEDPRRLENVDVVRRCEMLDQNMLLALNSAKGLYDTFSDSEDITRGLAERLIKVSTADGQTARLGAFYTNMSPFKRSSRIVIGIFPFDSGAVEYVIRPDAPEIRRGSPDNTLYNSSYSHFRIRWETICAEDPMLVFNRLGPDFLFYRQSPFGVDSPYRTSTLLKSMSDEERYEMLFAAFPFEFALEENVIYRALRIIDKDRLPRLFTQTGFATFINSHCSDPRYVDLHAAFTQKRRDLRRR